MPSRHATTWFAVAEFLAMACNRASRTACASAWPPICLGHCEPLLGKLPTSILENVPEEVATAKVAELRAAGACAPAEASQ